MEASVEKGVSGDPLGNWACKECMGEGKEGRSRGTESRRTELGRDRAAAGKR